MARTTVATPVGLVLLAACSRPSPSGRGTGTGDVPCIDACGPPRFNWSSVWR